MSTPTFTYCHPSIDSPTGDVRAKKAAMTQGSRPRFVRSNSGQAMVETALSLLIALSISFAVFEVSIMMYSYCVLNEAVREGVRYAIIHGSASASCSGPSSGCADGTSANVKAAVVKAAQSSFQSIKTTDVQVTYTPTNSCDPNSGVMVTITKAYSPLVGFLAIKPTLTVKSQGRIVD